MVYCFCIKSTDNEGVVRYIDIPDVDCRNGTELILSKEFYGGDTQKWMWDENRIVSSVSSPNFSLAVKQIRHNAPILLRFKELESIGDSYNVRWVQEDGVIKVEDDPNFYIGINRDSIVLLSVEENTAPTQWETRVIITDHLHNQAITCSLEYEPAQHLPIIDCWTIENTICIKKSSDHTYFGVIKFAPGGHVGLQQVDENRRSAVFTLFDGGQPNSIEVLKQGDGVETSSFEDGKNVNNDEEVGDCGASGTMAVKDIYWMTYQDITFKVTGEKLFKGCESLPKWRCTCWYSIGQCNEWEHIATFQRPAASNTALFNHQFSSYIKDWNPTEFESHALQRLAEFSESKLITGRGTEEKKQNKKNRKRADEVYDYRESTFNILGEFTEKQVEYKSFGAVKALAVCFVLSTGGKTGADIFGSLSADGCEQRTNKSGTKLFLSKF